MKKIFGIVAVMLSVILVENAYAMEYKPYVAGRAAYVFMDNDANQWVSDRGYTSTIVNETLEDNVWGAKLAIGNEFKVCKPYAKAFRVELEYGITDDSNNKGSYGHNINGWTIPTEYGIESRVQTVMVNAYWDINTGTKFVPYVGAGVGYANIREKAYVSNQYDTQTAKDHEDNLAWQVSAGVSYEITADLDTELGWRYTDYGDIKNSETRGYYNSSSSRDYDSHEILLGMRYTF